MLLTLAQRDGGRLSSHLSRRTGHLAAWHRCCSVTRLSLREKEVQRMDKKKKFYWMWLLVGMVQLGALVGCNGNSQGEQLLSQGPGGEAGGGSESGTASTPPQAPIRISRGFFEKKLAAQVSFGQA